ncbi:MAG: (Fe-S)-binding protein [Chloroflexi bacterium]|nr:(Fe-S)-binding protein [Chloroflexota bacterium]
MTVQKRPSPKNKPVSLFVTCMVDMLYPQTGMSVVKVLEHLGIKVNFPQGQTCCGQPGFNAGYRDEARQVATQFLRAFADAELIVTPSGSCAAMVRHEYPRLFADNPAQKAEAERLASITWEFTEFLADGLEITDINGRLPHLTTFAFHDACHGLRLLGLGDAGRKLVSQLDNAEVVEMAGHDLCCGFGGLFSVKMADVSGAMLANKLDAVNACPAQLLTGDVSCLTHMNGGLEKTGSAKQVQHIADILAAAIDRK